MAKHKRKMLVEVISTPGRDYSGKPYRRPSFRYHYQDGTPVTLSDAGLNDLASKGMGLELFPGDELIVTIEVIGPKRRQT